jgi:hypothetical protein
MKIKIRILSLTAASQHIIKNNNFDFRFTLLFNDITTLIAISNFHSP